jgi:hypothetical protein
MVSRKGAKAQLYSVNHETREIDESKETAGLFNPANKLFVFRSFRFFRGELAQWFPWRLCAFA